jgi:hypothetical protein
MSNRNDDHILPLTRIIAAIIIVVLLLAFLALYLFPTHTDTNFAWTIQPPTSAILFGAGYTAGAFFFARLLGARKWHRVQAGFLPITLFTIIMLLSTLLHWDRFHHTTLPFYLWTSIYALTPLLVPLIWALNRRRENKGLEQKDIRFSRFTRLGLDIAGLAGILFFLIAFIRPSILISLTPWKLTPLTARVFCGWSLLTAASVLSIAMDGRWSAARILVESAMVGIGLTLLALPRMWPDLDLGKPMTWLFIAGLAVTFIGFGVLHVVLDRSSKGRKPATEPNLANE